MEKFDDARCIPRITGRFSIKEMGAVLGLKFLGIGWYHRTADTVLVTWSGVLPEDGKYTVQVWDGGINIRTSVRPSQRAIKEHGSILADRMYSVGYRVISLPMAQAYCAAIRLAPTEADGILLSSRTRLSCLVLSGQKAPMPITDLAGDADQLITLVEFKKLGAYLQGYVLYMQAEHEGSELKTHQACPYEKGSCQHKEWIEGQCKAAADTADCP